MFGAGLSLPDALESLSGKIQEAVMATVGGESQDGLMSFQRRNSLCFSVSMWLKEAHTWDVHLSLLMLRPVFSPNPIFSSPRTVILLSRSLSPHSIPRQTAGNSKESSCLSVPASPNPPKHTSHVAKAPAQTPSVAPHLSPP